MATEPKSPKPVTVRNSETLRDALEIETPRMRKAVEATRPETVERWVQEAAEPRQWSWPSERRLIGQRIPRLDGAIKATGEATYSYDINQPRLCYGKILRCPHGRARIVSLNMTVAERAPGVVSVQVLAETGAILRYHGDPIAAVAAETEEQARDAQRLIEVEYEVLPHVVTEEDAMQPDAPQVNEDGNIRIGRLRSSGDVQVAMEDADVNFEGIFRTQVQTHSSLETHGVVAEWNGDDLTVWASTQGVHAIRQSLSNYFEIPATRVHVVTPVMGGGFGSKLGPGVEDATAAELARSSGRPVKMLLERDEEHLDTGNRPSAVARVRAGATQDGTLTAFEATGYGTGGITSGANFPMPYIYSVANSYYQATAIYTDAGNQRAMRAPGHPQGSFITEAVMDELATRLQMDPVEFRQNNLPEDSLWGEQLDLGAARIGWENWHTPGDPTPGPIKKGLGCAISTWGSGGGRTRASCTIHPDGSVEMNTGTQDIGTGTRTIVAIVTAEILGLEVEDITVNIGNSDYPYSGSSGGSTTIPSVCPAVRVTAGLALEALFEQIAPQLEVAADQLEARVGAIGVVGNPGRSWSWSEACRILGSQPISVDGQWEPGLSSSGVNGAQFAAVTVDTETGVVTVDKVSAFHDCGLVIDELTAESQVNGGIIGGLSYALFEERIMDRPTGRMVNPDFEMYHVAGPSDMPEFDVHMMDVPERGVLGLGEPPTIPTAAAIANAVANAIGVRVHSLPITPEKVLAALHEGPEATLPATRFDLLDAAIAAEAEGSGD
jgi:xanthine dehydrogenase YagR molybdenum-binding subunit